MGKPPFEQIFLICNSENLPGNFETVFNYSTRWKNKKLNPGDRIEFKANIKKSVYYVHRIERWVDTWNTLPADMIDSEEEIEIINVKEITKL